MKQNDHTNTNSGDFSKGTTQRSGATIVTKTMEIPDRVKRDMSRNMGIGTGSPRTQQCSDTAKK